jgi:hypothetical protein
MLASTAMPTALPVSRDRSLSADPAPCWACGRAEVSSFVRQDSQWFYLGPAADDRDPGGYSRMPG